MTERPEAADPLSFDGHTPRQLPAEGEVISLAGEIAALLDRHARERDAADGAHRAEVGALRLAAGRAVQLAFHLERTIEEAAGPPGDAGPGPLLRRLRILKDQIKAHWGRQGFSWRDPTGEDYTPELAEWVEVDGWRHDSEYPTELIVETREPVVLYQGEVILKGAVVVGAPSDPPGAAPGNDATPTQNTERA